MRALAFLFPLLLANTAVAGDEHKQADETSIPAPIRAMLEAAIASGNDGEVSTIVKYARTADPASGDAVAKVAADWREERKRAHDTRVREARVFDLWRGRAELGGYLTTGNSDTVGATGVLDLTREGLQWRHKMRLQGDYQRSLGITTREHYLASYEPNYKIDSRRYIYGATQFESDRFLGYTQRYATSVGAGYSAIQTPAIKLDVELGPAYRYTAFTDHTTQASVAARGSVDFGWKFAPGLKLTQVASAYLQHYNSTISGTTALAAKVLGPLSAQISYVVQYESMPPEGRRTTDTTSRASLVYSF
jgi:putative salt-induced outer membrane protein